MEPSSGMMAGRQLTPIREKNPFSPSLNLPHASNHSENTNPNLTTSSPCLQSPNSPSPSLNKSSKKSHSSLSRNPHKSPVLPSPSPRNKIRQRKFVFAKKNSKNEKTNISTVVCNCNISGKCLCVAYETLRASQDDFFKNPSGKGSNLTLPTQNLDLNNATDGLVSQQTDEVELSDEMGKRRRNKVLEEETKVAPQTGSGRVMRLVEAFEKLLSQPESEESDEQQEQYLGDINKGIKWALPGLQPHQVSETQISSSSFCPSEFFLTSVNLGLDRSSLGSNQGRTSDGGSKSRRNLQTAESSGSVSRRYWKRRQIRPTRQKPFELKTEQRGKWKEEEFTKKVRETLAEEDKRRIPIAQGLPWTTDEQECLIKPAVKESTRPIDLILHSEVRAAERAEFDHQVAEKLNLIEQYRTERDRQRQVEEEEEIRRLRKELVPKAQRMPYFDRPFIPRRSLKHPTIPKEPRFHIPELAEHKKIKCCLSWKDLYTQ